MKNFIVANRNDNSKRYKKENVELLLNAQIDNSIELGWNKKDIILISNFDYDFLGVKAIKTDLNEFCWTGSKMFALKWYFENHNVDDIIWAHDLDCWQNIWFYPPKFKRDIGAVHYSNPKYNALHLYLF